MSLWTFVGAAAALSLERACYVWIARAPGRFRRWCARPAVAGLGEPVAIVRKLFYGFKVVQLSVLGGWCYLQGSGSLGSDGRNVLAVGVGGALVLAGQALFFVAMRFPHDDWILLPTLETV